MNDPENTLKQFIDEHVKIIEPLNSEYAESYFNATISGKSEDYQKAADIELQINKKYANKTDFSRLKKIKESNAVNEPVLKRQLDILYNEYLSKQIDEKLLEEIVRLQIKNENIYATHRVNYNNKTFTDNQVDEILKTSKNEEELKGIYLVSKEIGKIVESDILKLVDLRNKSARELGFDNYHSMILNLAEQNPDQIEQLFDELDKQTREPYRNIKKEIDTYLATRLGIKTAELMPWHYQNRYFQEAPEIFNRKLDYYFADKDIEKITSEYFASISLPINDMIKRSDLYEKENKYQHAYCIDIDRCGDVRVVCNIKPNSDWMGTMLHEFGHAVYDKYIENGMPWLLRTHAHIFTTEAIAMFFGRLASNLEWIKKYTVVNNENGESVAKTVKKNLQMKLLVFSRWAQVMYRFEKQLYENPDQNLNKLWWDLVEKYQEIKRPEKRNEPDWASKIHVALYPAYYHNYMLGELLASQLQHFLMTKYGNYFTGDKIGNYLKEYIFTPGAKYSWSEMIERSTGESLNPLYFVQQVTNNHQ